MGWAYLLGAVVLEIAWASTLKWTDGYSRPGPTMVNLLLCGANLWVLAQAMKHPLTDIGNEKFLADWATVPDRDITSLVERWLASRG